MAVIGNYFPKQLQRSCLFTCYVIRIRICCKCNMLIGKKVWNKQNCILVWNKPAKVLYKKLFWKVLQNDAKSCQKCLILDKFEKHTQQKLFLSARFSVAAQRFKKRLSCWNCTILLHNNWYDTLKISYFITEILIHRMLNWRYISITVL